MYTVMQVETPEMLKVRNAAKGKREIKDKVVQRELCSILSRGTRTYGFLDEVASAPDGSPSSVNMILALKVRALPLTLRSTSHAIIPKRSASDVYMIPKTYAQSRVG